MHMIWMFPPPPQMHVSGLDSKENYLNSLPRREVCFVVFHCLLLFLCVYCVIKNTALLKKFGMSARTNLKVLEKLICNLTEVHHLKN